MYIPSPEEHDPLSSSSDDLSSLLSAIAQQKQLLLKTAAAISEDTLPSLLAVFQSILSE